MQQPEEPVGEPFGGRAVQAQFRTDGRDAGRVGLVPGQGYSGVARQRLGQREDQQHDGGGLRDTEQQPAREPGAQRRLHGARPRPWGRSHRRHASHTLSNRAQSRVLAGASCATPRTRRDVPTIQSAKPHTRKPPSACRRRCIRP